jgi:hypothetical protein
MPTFNRITRRRWLGLAGWPALAWVPAAHAARPLPPKGPVILTVTGRDGLRADFDVEGLAAMPQRTLVTRTPWYDGPRRFTGPLLRDLLAAAGASGGQLQAVALNDYRVEIPVEDVQRHDVVVARLIDDRPIPVREKGPLFVMYPFDDKPALANPTYFSRCIWQLRSIQVS